MANIEQGLGFQMIDNCAITTYESQQVRWNESIFKTLLRNPHVNAAVSILYALAGVALGLGSVYLLIH